MSISKQNERRAELARQALDLFTQELRCFGEATAHGSALQAQDLIAALGHHLALKHIPFDVVLIGALELYRDQRDQAADEQTATDEVSVEQLNGLFPLFVDGEVVDHRGAVAFAKDFATVMAQDYPESGETIARPDQHYPATTMPLMR